MALTTISGEIQAQPLNDNFSYLDSKVLITSIYNVLDSAYGAIGDGITDDTVSIQAAIDAAETAGGGIVWIPTGYTFLCNSTLTVAGTNITFFGSGTIYFNFTSTFFLRITSAATDIVIDGIIFTGPIPTARVSTFVTISNSGTRTKIINCTFMNSPNYHLYIVTATDCIVSNNTFIGIGQGITKGGDGVNIAFGSSYVDVVGNTFVNVDDDCIALDAGLTSIQHINVIGNNIYNGGSRGIAIGSNCNGALIEGNYVNNCVGGGVEMFLNISTAYSTYVSIIGNSFVDSGSAAYTLLLDYCQNTVVNGNVFDTSIGSAGAVFISRFVNLKIQNNTFRNVTAGRGIVLNDGVVLDDTTNLMITNNSFDTTYLQAIYLAPFTAGATLTTIDDVVISNNSMVNTDTSNLVSTSVSVFNANGLTMTNNIASFQAFGSALVTYDTASCTGVYTANNYPI